MQWSDEITLISTQAPAAEADRTNKNGFAAPPEETPVTVFANKKSVGFNEFFRAQQAGYTEQLKFDIFTEEYDGQQLAEYDGKRYKILRTYTDPKTNGEYTELTLSDLSQKGANNGDV